MTAHDLTDEDTDLWSRQPSDGGVVRPSADQSLPWSRAAVEPSMTNTVYLVGCHGGAGVDTLAAMVEGATPASRAWPIRGEGDEATPLPVVLVARTSLAGLAAAQFALRQYATGGAPDGTELLGLALIAASPRTKLSKAEETKRRLIADGVTPLAPQVWQIKWHSELLGMPLEDLPSWSADGDEMTNKRGRSLTKGLTADVVAFGSSLRTFLETPESSVVVDEPEIALQEDTDDEDALIAAEPEIVSIPSRSSERTVPPVPAMPFVRSPKPSEYDAITEQIPVVRTSADLAEVRHPVASPVTAGGGRLLGSPATAGRASKRRMVLAAGGASVVVVLGIVVLFALIGGGSDDAQSAPTSPSVQAQVTPAPVSGCRNEVVGGVVSRADAGSQRSGPEVIKAFNDAYYVQRSARAAHAVAAKGALEPEAAMQKTLDEIPVGTTHCLAIREQGADQFVVELIQTPPGGGAPTVYHQLIRITEAGGKYWISSITPINPPPN